MNPSPDCRKTRPRLSAYHDAALDGASRDAVRAHLARCKACQAELAAIAGVSALVAGTISDARPGFNARLAGKIAAAQGAEDRWAARGRLARRMSLATAAALLAAVLGFGPALVRDFRGASPATTDEQILDLALWGTGPDDVESES
ncbi:MAG: anti-sigma factor [Myxococcota bacterium]